MRSENTIWNDINKIDTNISVMKVIYWKMNKWIANLVPSIVSALTSRTQNKRDSIYIYCDVTAAIFSAFLRDPQIKMGS